MSKYYNLLTGEKMIEEEWFDYYYGRDDEYYKEKAFEEARENWIEEQLNEQMLEEWMLWTLMEFEEKSNYFGE